MRKIIAMLAIMAAFVAMVNIVRRSGNSVVEESHVVPQPSVEKDDQGRVTQIITVQERDSAVLPVHVVDIVYTHIVDDRNEVKDSTFASQSFECGPEEKCTPVTHHIRHDWLVRDSTEAVSLIHYADK